MMPRLTRKRGLAAVVVAICFVFAAPLFPTRIASNLILPERNQCAGALPLAGDTSLVDSSYTSLSYQLFGAFGTIYVPSNGNNSIQFPPLGDKSLACDTP